MSWTTVVNSGFTLRFIQTRRAGCDDTILLQRRSAGSLAMVQNIVGVNTLYHDLECPFCGKAVRSGIGFRVGAIKRLNYRMDEKLAWDGPNCRPVERPIGGNLKTIGYFNCDNPSCETWKDCFPDVQEALITIANGVISDVQVTTYKPQEQTFDILEPEEVS